MKICQLSFLVVVLLATSVVAQSPAKTQRAADWCFEPKTHEVDLQSKQWIESNLLWMIDRAEHPVQPAVKRRPDAALIGVYADAGVWPLGAHSVVASLEASGFAVEVIDWNRLQNSDLTRFHALVFPGGYSYFQQLSAGQRGLDAVADYMQQGGRYLGICAGAFLAAKDVHWEGKTYPYPLVLFDGVAEGSIKDIAAWPGAGQAKLTVTAAGKKFGIAAADGKEIYYQGGCRFLGGSGVITLAKYFDGSAAIIQRPFGRDGKGTVVLTGVHFERPASSTNNRTNEFAVPPALSYQILPQLLGVAPGEVQIDTRNLTLRKYRTTVTSKATEAQWHRRQHELRLRLSQLHASKFQIGRR